MKPHLTQSANTQHKLRRLPFKQLYYELQSLDSQNVGSWPLAVKGLVLMAVIFMTSLIGYLIPINSQLKQIDAQKNQQQVLLDTYQAKQRQLNQAKSNFDEIHANKIKVGLAKLSQLMPNEQPSSLAQQYHQLERSSGILIQDLELGGEEQRDFYKEQPIKLTATGSYAQIGEFLTRLAALSRLITIHDFSVEAAQTKRLPSVSTSPTLKFVLTTKAYRANLAATSSDTAKPDTEMTSIIPTLYRPKIQRSPFSLPKLSQLSLNNVTKPGADDKPISPSESKKSPNTVLQYFKYRGMMITAGKTAYGLVQYPDGVIVRVKAGQTVGQDNMKVVEITPTQINLSQKTEHPTKGLIIKNMALVAPISPL